jgi:hypothetical protein
VIVKKGHRFVVELAPVSAALLDQLPAAMEPAMRQVAGFRYLQGRAAAERAGLSPDTLADKGEFTVRAVRSP